MRKLLCALALLFAVAVVAGSPAKAASRAAAAGAVSGAGVICPNHPPCRPNQFLCFRSGCSFCCNVLASSGQD